MKKWYVPVLIGVTITLIFSFFAVVKLLPLERLELLLYDFRYHLRGSLKPPPEILIVAIDDQSLAALGRWPWDRKTVASIIETLSSLGAKVIFLDVILSEPSPGDDKLAAAIGHAGNVVLPIVFDFSGERKSVKDPAFSDNAFPMVRGTDNFKLFPPLQAKSALLPLKDLSAKAASLGHINMVPDRDGVLRWEVLAVEQDGELFPSVDLQVARMAEGLPIEAMTLKATEGVQLGERFIPTDPWQRALIHYYGPAGTFPAVSAIDLLRGKINASTVKDRIVLFGATAVGIYDLRVTPVSPAMAGVEKHASVISSFLEGRLVQRTGTLITILIILLSGLTFSILIGKVRAIAGAVVTVGYLGVLFLLAYHAFTAEGLWLDLSYCANNVLAIYLAVSVYRYATEERYAKKIRAMFSSYVTEKIVAELIKNPNLAKLGGERRELTVLFSDVRGFTVYSEQHAPEEVVTILNEYLGEMTKCIFRWDGTLNKFVGDMIVAFWGAPLPQENHAELAVRCALDMRRRLKDLHEKWIAEGREPLDCGIGINSGEAVVGNIGAEGKKMEYTVIGDNVNLGARVEALTRKYETSIIITEYTLAYLKSVLASQSLGHVIINGLDRVAVKGKKQPVAIYEVCSIPEGKESSITECAGTDFVRFTEK
jgi:adenylate cyclase